MQKSQLMRPAPQLAAHHDSGQIHPAHMLDGSPRQAALRQLKEMINTSPRLRAVQARFAEAPSVPGGLPAQLKSGIESLSGMSMDHVKVHYNSDQPRQLNAHAYAQGREIHVAPGQERHLPHEAWHVVQQAQGRVAPTRQMKAGVAINDDHHLEHEADVMGQRAMQMQVKEGGHRMAAAPRAGADVAQLATLYKKNIGGLLPHWEVTAFGKEPSKDLENGNEAALWQVGFANPTGIKAMSGSVATKSGSPLGFAGEGEVHWSKRRNDQPKVGYQMITKSESTDQDQQLLNDLPVNGTRRTYRLTSQNCQHFIVDAWSKAGLQPDITNHLTLSAQGGRVVNSGLIGGLGATVGAMALGFGALPVIGAGLAGAFGMGLGRYLYSGKNGKNK